MLAISRRGHAVVMCLLTLIGASAFFSIAWAEGIDLRLNVKIGPDEFVQIKSAMDDYNLWNYARFRYRIDGVFNGEWRPWQYFKDADIEDQFLESQTFHFQFDSVLGYGTPTNITVTAGPYGEPRVVVNANYQVPVGTIKTILVKNGADGKFSITGPHTDIKARGSSLDKPYRTGTYHLSFSKVENYILSVQTSGGFNVSGNSVDGALGVGQVITVTAVWTPDEDAIKRGRLIVEATPFAAANAGGWRFSHESAWRKFGGAGLANVDPGIYTVTYKEVAGYNKPPDRPVTIIKGKLATLNAVYFDLDSTGLQVTLTDSVDGERAKTLGAAWRLVTDSNNGTWRPSEEIVELPHGSHTIEFKPVHGFVTPGRRSVTITGLATILASYYRPMINHGTDIDGDGRDEPAIIDANRTVKVVDPSIKRGAKLRPLISRPLDSLSDVPVFGDYDGDGTSDYAIWREPGTNEGESGVWTVPDHFEILKFGRYGDIPVPGDYTGDGRTDPALYRPGTGTWLIYDLGSGRIFLAKVGGKAGDIPVPGNWDGDAAGRTEPAVMNSTTGEWIYALRRANGIWKADKKTRFKFGETGDIPVPADFLGDGHLQPAVYRPTEGIWLISKLYQVNLGGAGMIPLAADWDGQGRALATVFDPATGIWKSEGDTLILKKFGKGGVPLGSSH